MDFDTPLEYMSEVWIVSHMKFLALHVLELYEFKIWSNLEYQYKQMLFNIIIVAQEIPGP